MCFFLLCVYYTWKQKSGFSENVMRHADEAILWFLIIYGKYENITIIWTCSHIGIVYTHGTPLACKQISIYSNVVQPRNSVFPKLVNTRYMFSNHKLQSNNNKVNSYLGSILFVNIR